MTQPEPLWLGRLAVDEAHFRLLREHGGAHGLRDENALEAALARPRNVWAYRHDATLAELGAAYAFGLARGHAYVDGNKRIALVVLAAFLDRNGAELTATNREALVAILALAAGELDEAGLTAWIEHHSRPAR